MFHAWISRRTLLLGRPESDRKKTSRQKNSPVSFYFSSFPSTPARKFQRQWHTSLATLIRRSEVAFHPPHSPQKVLKLGCLGCRCSPINERNVFCLVDYLFCFARARMGQQGVSLLRAVLLLAVPLTINNFFGQLNVLQLSSVSIETTGVVELTKEATEERIKTTRNHSISINTKPYSMKNVSNIFWLHIQKTGTSFFNTIFYHFCPRARHSGKELPMADRKIIDTFPPDQWCDDNVSIYNLPRVGLHRPYRRRNETFWTFTMFRDPSERLRSAFAYDWHGIMPRNKSSLTFDEYVRTPQIPNCQIKMVLGHPCHKLVEPSQLNVSKALQRVDSPYFFFGLTDRWDESLCLFHSQFGGTIESYERLNNRKTGNMVVNRTERSILQPPTDLDTEFVNAVEKIFERRLRDANCTSSKVEEMISRIDWCHGNGRKFHRLELGAHQGGIIQMCIQVSTCQSWWCVLAMSLCCGFLTHFTQ